MVANLHPRPFVPLPVYLVRDITLSDGALRLYALLRDHAGRRGYCWPGQTRLAEALSRSEVTIRRWIGELVAAGLIIKQRRGLTQTNVYRMVNLALIKPLQDKVIVPAPERNLAIDLERSPMIDKLEQEEQEQGEHFDNSMAALPGFDDASETSVPCRTPRPYDPNRARIAPLILDLRRDLHDRAPATATVTRATNIFKRAEVDLDRFAAAVYAARSITQERSGGIRSMESESGRKTKTAYFFACLEDCLGLRSARDARPSAGSGAAPPATASVRSTPNMPPLDDPQPARAWPADLTALGVPDRIAFIRQCGRGPFDDPTASIAFAKRHLGRLR